jgi:hypothetical protein
MFALLLGSAILGILLGGTVAFAKWVDTLEVRRHQESQLRRGI